MEHLVRVSRVVQRIRQQLAPIFLPFALAATRSFERAVIEATLALRAALRFHAFGRCLCMAAIRANVNIDIQWVCLSGATGLIRKFRHHRATLSSSVVPAWHFAC